MSARTDHSLHGTVIHSPEGRYEQKRCSPSSVLQCRHRANGKVAWVRVAGSGAMPATMCCDCMEYFVCWFAALKDAKRVLPLLRLAFDDDYHHSNRGAKRGGVKANHD